MCIAVGDSSHNCSEKLYPLMDEIYAVFCVPVSEGPFLSTLARRLCYGVFVYLSV